MTRLQNCEIAIQDRRLTNWNYLAHADSKRVSTALGGNGRLSYLRQTIAHAWERHSIPYRIRLIFFLVSMLPDATCYDSLVSQFEPEDFFAGIATHTPCPTVTANSPPLSSRGGNVIKGHHCWSCQPHQWVRSRNFPNSKGRCWRRISPVRIMPSTPISFLHMTSLAESNWHNNWRTK